MKTKYYAQDVPVLNMSYQPDSLGMVIPPEAYAEFPTKMKVTYGPEGHEVVIGTATLRRKGNQILANMSLTSSMKDVAISEAMIRKLYPAVSFMVKEASGEEILVLEIYELFLTTYGNEDKGIEILDSRLVRIGGIRQ